jgi:transposase-like protein
MGNNKGSKFKTDYERLEIIKEYKVSHLSMRAFALKKGISREALRTWVKAFDNIDGSFINLNKAVHSSEPSVVLENEDVAIKMLDSETIYTKSHSFSRFDHSIVVIEFERIKITTSLSQALEIMEKYYDRFK